MHEAKKGKEFIMSRSVCSRKYDFERQTLMKTHKKISNNSTVVCLKSKSI